MTDDRVSCETCRAYRVGRCNSVTGFWARCEIPPEIRHLPIRCIGFTPLVNAEDGRTAEQRWPWLLEPKEVKQAEKQDYRYGTPLSARRKQHDNASESVGALFD